MSCNINDNIKQIAIILFLIFEDGCILATSVDLRVRVKGLADMERTSRRTDTSSYNRHIS